MKRFSLVLFLFISLIQNAFAEKGFIPLFYWNLPNKDIVNFGDYLSKVLIERMSHGAIPVISGPSGDTAYEKKFLALGSILHLSREGDVLWGTGINGNNLSIHDYQFATLDIRAVRGPLTRKFLIEQLDQDCAEVYGDPCLLFSLFFQEYQKVNNPSRPYVIIPHMSELHLFPKHQVKEVIYPTQNWQEVLEAILDSELVISSSLHGIILAEVFGVPARMLRVTCNEHIFKYQDYYYSTGRENFQYATSIQEALVLGGESLPCCIDLKKLYEAFPFELWPDVAFINPFLIESEGVVERPAR